MPRCHHPADPFSMKISTAPRDAAAAAQENPGLWPGTDERFSGYGVMGLPFASGHYLAMRNMPAATTGPEYRTIWHRAPNGTWTFISDSGPEQTCARYFAPGDSAIIVHSEITVTWEGPYSLRVEVPDTLDWGIEMAATPATMAMSALMRPIPPRMWRNRVFQRAIRAAAPALLRSGNVNIRGAAPNGQRFVWGPRRVWTITHSRAILRGVDLGLQRPPRVQLRLGDFWLPQRGLFAIGASAFENFDPTRHVLPSGSTVISQPGRNES
jgi:hypothetical protein